MLSKLLKKGARWRWSESEDAAFNKLKQKFIESEILAHPNFNKPFKLFCDASQIAVGACLM